jgi:ATP-binding cassette subfamily B protein
MPDLTFDEEEFSTEFNGQTVLRIFGLVTKHWPWLVGFLVTIGIVSALDAYFTFLGARIIDEGIIGEDLEVLREIVITYGGLDHVSCDVRF